MCHFSTQCAKPCVLFLEVKRGFVSTQIPLLITFNFTISFELFCFSLGMLTKNTKALLFSVLFLCGLIRPAFSQSQFMGWATTFQNYKLTPRFGFYFDIQYRSTDQMKQLQALLIRPGINVYITPRLTGTFGYAFIPQQRFNAGVEGYLPEHRIYEQLVYTHPVKIARHRSTLMHRVRLEQRFLPKHHVEGDHLVRDGHREAHRLRYFFREVAPLKNNEVAFTKGFFAALQNEVLVNVGDRSAVNGKFFDQNRLLVASGYRVSKQFDVELGYMNQYISGAGSASTTNHIMHLATYVRL